MPFGVSGLVLLLCHNLGPFFRGRTLGAGRTPSCQKRVWGLWWGGARAQAYRVLDLDTRETSLGAAGAAEKGRSARSASNRFF